ncbi:hypothetical protein CPB85DRAFT_1443140 [Mucidula mucida]|nr:hypothetical protein CPB85DRAFT_1443140 [Mucidula mucida]
MSTPPRELEPRPNFLRRRISNKFTSSSHDTSREARPHYHDAKRRREDALREHTTKSREKAVLPPAIHSVEWDATTLVDEIRMERSMGRTRQTAAERIKTEWETRPNLLRRRAPLEEDDATTPHSMPHPRPRPLSTPVSPSDDLREHEGSTAPRHQSVPGFDAQVIVSGHVRQPLELKVYSPSEMAAELEMKRAGG